MWTVSNSLNFWEIIDNGELSQNLPRFLGGRSDFHKPNIREQIRIKNTKTILRT